VRRVPGRCQGGQGWGGQGLLHMAAALRVVPPGSCLRPACGWCRAVVLQIRPDKQAGVSTTPDGQ
jgi:hypothetical protein